MVESMRDEATGAWQACLKRPGRRTDAIAAVGMTRSDVTRRWSGEVEKRLGGIDEVDALYPRCSRSDYDACDVIGR